MKYQVIVKVAWSREPNDSWTESWDWESGKDTPVTLKEVKDYAAGIIISFNCGKCEEQQRTLVGVSAIALYDGATIAFTPEDKTVILRATAKDELPLQRTLLEVLHLREALEDESESDVTKSVSELLDWLFDPGKTLSFEELLSTIRCES